MKFFGHRLAELGGLPAPPRDPGELRRQLAALSRPSLHDHLKGRDLRIVDFVPRRRQRTELVRVVEHAA